MKWINDRYKIIQELSGGNLSKVYLCLDYANEKQDVVIKAFDYTDEKQGTLYSNLFFRELENLDQLEHPGVIKLLDKGNDNENKIYYLALEYFEGQTLDQVIQHDSYTDNQKYHLLFQLIDAMSYAHSKQVIHRDLKPSNILYNGSDEVKIIDFGTSKIKGSLYGDFTVSNYITKKYASWEQMASKKIDYRTDIYSLGIIMFELLSGEFVPEEQDVQEAIRGDKKLGTEIKEILLKMTETYPTNRYDSLFEVRTLMKDIFAEQLRNQTYGIAFTKKAISHLVTFGFIQSPDRLDAQKVIFQDLTKSKTYLESLVSNKQGSQPAYKLYGKQLEYLCALDNLTGSTLTIIGIHFRNATTHDMNKERSFWVEGEWDVRPAINRSMHFDDVKVLLQDVEEKKRLYVFNEQKEVAEKRSIERWAQVLRLYSKELQAQKNTMKYVGFDRDTNGERIWVELEQRIEGPLFNEDQLLTMTSRQNIEKTKNAGYCVDIEADANKLVIQLGKDTSPDDFAASGEISVDMRMEQTAISRQIRALKSVRHKELQNKDLAEIFFKPELAQSFNLVQDVKFQSELDSSKKEAIKKALQAKDIFLLQGPPGTGKTTFISELVYQILERKPSTKVLISSQSNVAVDHALNKIDENVANALILRIGSVEKLSLGTEKFTIEKQLDGWFSKIKQKCELFLEKYKQEIGLDENITKQYNVVVEIDQIKSRIEEIEKLEFENNRKKILLKERYDNLKILINDVQRMAATIQSKTEGVNELELLEIVSEFRNEMLGVGNEFVKRMEQTFELALYKDELEADRRYLKGEKEDLSQKLDLLKDIINVETPDDFLNFKQSMKQKLSLNQEKYNKISKVEKIQKEWISRVGTEDKLNDVMIRRANIIGATCLGIARMPSVGQVPFDWVIIDEAGRATPPELLVPMTMGKKVVLVGDHKQLPPLVDQNIKKLDLKKENIQVKDLEVSLFEELMKGINNDCYGSLREQYRMHPAIGGLVSKVFYEGNLESKTLVTDRVHSYTRWENKGVVWMSTSEMKDRFEQAVKGSKSFQNHLEAQVIFKTLVDMERNYSNRMTKKEVGIIAGYQAQKTLLRKILETEYKDHFQYLDIEINTVDAFQGRETDIIFYSVVRSNVKGKIGFLGDERRLNVALSRARELLIIIGDHMAVTQEAILSQGQVNPFVNVVQYILANSELCILERL